MVAFPPLPPSRFIARCVQWSRQTQRTAERVAARGLSAWQQFARRLQGASARPSTGEQGELVAARFLRRHGFRIITRRYRNRYGELDIVALDQRVIVFVEVKTWHEDLRRDDDDPSVAVDEPKQLRLTRTALAFLKQFDLLEHPARFDVVSVILAPSQDPRIRHFVNAFEPVGVGQWYS